MQKCDFNLWVFFCKYATYLQQNAFFKGQIWRPASVYHSKYRGYKCRDSLKAGKKLFEIHFTVINTSFNFIYDFRLVAKYQFSEAVVLVNKTRKRGYIRLWYQDCNFKFYVRQTT